MYSLVFRVVGVNGFEMVFLNGFPGRTSAHIRMARGGGVMIKPPAGYEIEDIEKILAADFRIDPINWETVKTFAQMQAASSTPKPQYTKTPSPPLSGIWSKEDAALLDGDIMTHPLPEPTFIQIDHREPPELKALLHKIKNLIIEECALECGDIVLPGKLIIERKTALDFGASIREDAKRLFKQTTKMTRQPEIGILMLEGEIYERTFMTIPQITGTLSYLANLGIVIFPTINIQHTAYSIVKLVRHAAHGLGYDLGLRGAAPKHNQEAAIFFLEGLPGVSNTLARVLIAHFGSARGLAIASEAELRAVDGIGPKKARSIFETLNAAAKARK